MGNIDHTVTRVNLLDVNIKMIFCREFFLIESQLLLDFIKLFILLLEQFDFGLFMITFINLLADV